MAKYNTSRTDQYYKYVLCDYVVGNIEATSPAESAHFVERGQFGNVTGGSIEISANTDTGGSCSFTFEGVEPPRMRDVVRIYYGFTDTDGDSEEILLGTFMVSYSEVTYKPTADGGTMAAGTVEGRGMGAVLCDRINPQAEILSTGNFTNFATFASLRGAKVSSTYTYPIETSASIEGGKSVKDMLEDFFSNLTARSVATGEEIDLSPDTYVGRDGTINFVNKRVYTAGTAKTFGSSGSNLVQAEVVSETDAASCENVVRLVLDDGTDSICVWCANTDASHPSHLSTVNWVEKTHYEKIDEIQSTYSTLNSKKSALQSKARNMLKSISQTDTVTTIKHPIVGGFWVLDSVSLYGADGKTAHGLVESIGISLDASAQCTTKFKQTRDTSSLTYIEGVSWAWRM